MCVKYQAPVVMDSDAHWEGGRQGNHTYSEQLIPGDEFPGGTRSLTVL